MKLKRWRNRTAGVVLGVGLGWYGAGFLPSSLSGADAPGEGAAAPAAGEVEGTGGEAAVHVAGPADKLVPQEEMGWYRPVLAGVGGLFALAVVIGVPWVKYQSEERAAADGHGHDAHDAHGQDAQAAGQGGGHH